MVVGKNTLAFAILHKQIEREVLNEIVCVVSERLAIECVQKSVSGSVSRSTATVGLSTFAEILRLTSESTLITVVSVSIIQKPAQEAYILPSSVLEKGQP